MLSIYEGIFAKQFILFYGESLKYYIAEESTNGPSLTESDSLEASEWTVGADESAFGLLNDMCAADIMNDDKTLVALVKTYAERICLIEECLEIL